ncbi:restriction endonuclease subunit S [Vibrio parahaemolyticus]|uniref:restriction endonuclease subunit S n=1 Tax=Vibrio parahaemolyticus TaxID=670 RepID=UPI00236197E9|nr:restriction endonuclease subunit S [Vibrio parahaemolyticus]
MTYKDEKFGNLVSIVSEKIDTEDVDIYDYISTENMQPNLGGVGIVSQMPNTKKINAYKCTDTLFSNIRTYFRKVWYAEKDGGLSADVLVFRTKNAKKLLPQYLYYLVANEDFTKYSVRTSRGVKMPRGDKDALLEYPVSLPSISRQMKVCSLLSPIDEKIANNTAMNQTLEKIAQRIFKSWFIDFDPVKANKEGVAFDGLSPEIQALFPSEFEESELGMIPKGWEVQSLSSIGDIVTGKTPSTKDKENYGEDIPFITIPDMHGKVFVTSTNKSLSRKGGDLQPNKTVKKGAIAVSCIATPGLTVLIHEDCQTNQQINTLTPKNATSLYMFLSLSSMSKNGLFRHDGTVFSNMNKSSFSALQVKLPAKNIMAKFDDVIRPIFDKMLLNQKNSDNLANLRDRLLPKLISGQITVGEAQKELAEAI